MLLDVVRVVTEYFLCKMNNIQMVYNIKKQYNTFSRINQTAEIYNTHFN